MFRILRYRLPALIEVAACIWTLGLMLSLFCANEVVAQPAPAAAEQPAEVKPEVAKPVDQPVAAAPVPAIAPKVVLIHVPLPIQGVVDTQVMQQVERAVQNLPSDPRPILVLQFEGKEENTGEDSQFERALSLARFLSGERLRTVRTVAYLPQSVTGHAVLPVMACEQIIMHPDAELGNAGIAETNIDATLRGAYIEIAERRRVIPQAVALGMLDRAAAVSRVQTAAGTRFVLAEELAQLQRDGQVSAVDTVVREGDMALLSGRVLRVKYGLVSHLVSNQSELAAALELPRGSLDDHSLVVSEWRPIEVVIDGPIHPRLVTQITRGVNDAIAADTANLLVIRLHSAGGNLAQSLRLANFLALDLDRTKMRSVVFVQREARGDAALVALAADDLVVTPDAQLGGPGNGNLNKASLADAHAQLKTIAEAREREWSLYAAMLDPAAKVYRWTQGRRQEVRFLTDEEHDAMPEPGEWERGEMLNTANGLAATELQGSSWIHATLEDSKGLAALYGWSGTPTEIKANWALGFIEFLADPRLAFFLLFVAWAMLMVEMSAPGIGVPGFISGLCFVLFFWSQFLHGTAGLLEVLLFLFGFACVAVEIFVLPGIGIFGIGGGFLIVLSMVLASQTFVIPANSYQLRQVPLSLATIVAAASGGMAALVIAHRFLPRTPYFNRLLLTPLQGEEREEQARRESFGEWTQLQGKRGIAMTPLVPAGKAKIGSDLVEVLSEGELIDRGETVEVIEVQGTRVIVRRVE